MTIPTSWPPVSRIVPLSAKTGISKVIPGSREFPPDEHVKQVLDARQLRPD